MRSFWYLGYLPFQLLNIRFFFFKYVVFKIIFAKHEVIQCIYYPALQIGLLLVSIAGTGATPQDSKPQLGEHSEVWEKDVYRTHSCIHDDILHQRRQPGRKEYSVTPQVYRESSMLGSDVHRGRTLLDISASSSAQKNAKQPIRIFLNYDAVGHTSERDCRNVGDLVKVISSKYIIFQLCTPAFSFLGIN